MPAAFNQSQDQPACFICICQYATTGPEITPPPCKKANKVPSSATTVTSNGIAQLEKLGNSLEAGFLKFMGGGDNKNKVSVEGGDKHKHVLYEKQAVLEKSILFYQKFPTNQKMQLIMEAATEKYMKLTEEIVSCLDQDE
jgi:hypothetical protein